MHISLYRCAFFYVVKISPALPLFFDSLLVFTYIVYRFNRPLSLVKTPFMKETLR